MDKRKAANQRVKRCITDALFSLMREKNLSDIRITELISRAGVARASLLLYSEKPTPSAGFSGSIIKVGV